MISIEALREWHKALHTILAKEFPGLRIVNENKVDVHQRRWVFSTLIFPPNGPPKYHGGYFTLSQLHDDQETVLTIMGEYPHQLKKLIKANLEV